MNRNLTVVGDGILGPHRIGTRGTGPHGDYRKTAMNCIQSVRARFEQTSGVNTYAHIVSVQGLISFKCICALMCGNLFKPSVLTACARYM